MIKANELMLGDYVLASGIPRRVEAITKKKIGYHIDPQTDKRLYYARLSKVEPIEIKTIQCKEPGVLIINENISLIAGFTSISTDERSLSVHKDGLGVIRLIFPHLHKFQQAIRILQ